MSRPSAFAHWIARQAWRDPADMMERFRKSLEMAALAVQASLKDVVIEFDGKRHYLPNQDGERDQRQYYVASLERHKDGTLWPEITFGSFKASVENQYWLPRNIAWEQFEVERRGGRVVQDSECLRQYKEAIAEQVKRAEQLRRERDELESHAHEAARVAAVAILRDNARPFVEGENHDYLLAKGLKPSPGVRVATQDFKTRIYSSRYHEWRDDALVSRSGDMLIPMIEAIPGGKVWNVQRITRDGQKLFLSGSRKHGLYHRIKGSEDVFVVCEGFATGQTVHDVLGCTVLVAFDCGNLDAVVNFALGEAAGRPVIVAADNDWETALKPQMNGRNPGIAQADEIERHLSVPYMAPTFSPNDKGRSDWDDVRQRDGFEKAAEAMRDALARALRRWAGLPANDAGRLPHARLRASHAAQGTTPQPEPAPVPAPRRDDSGGGSGDQGDDDADVALLVEQHSIARSKPAHWGSRELSEMIYPEHFPHPNDKCTAPMGTRENLQYMMEVYGIECRYNQISKDHEIVIPGLNFSRDNYANAAMAELTSICMRNKMPTQNLDQYVLSIADRNSYNPISDWIRSVKWDGVDRVAQLLDTVRVPATFNPDIRDLLVSKWLLSAVAAAVRPKGFYCKGVLVFRGAQSRGKTTWFKRLVSDEVSQYARDGMHLDPNNKDTVFTACAHWLVELGELDATFRKADIASLKGFIPKVEDRLRRPFDRKDSMLPRRTVFFASVNDKEFLVDDTGNTRWWTVEVESLDYQHDIDMQQVFAQIYEAWYLKGMQWWLSEEEEAMLNASNADFEIVDPIEERIMATFDFSVEYDHGGNRVYNYAPAIEMQATEVLLEMGYDKPDRKQTISVGRVLTRMGLEPRKSNRGKVYKMPTRRLRATNDNYASHPAYGF